LALLGGGGGGGGGGDGGIGYSEAWNPPGEPTALPAAALRWPYTLHIAMELSPGSTLRDWIRLRPRDDIQAGAGAHIFRCLMEALRYVHTHGIIHRDIKPANILVHRGASELEPTVKLMDFGLAVFYDFGGDERDRGGGRGAGVEAEEGTRGGNGSFRPSATAVVQMDDSIDAAGNDEDVDEDEDEDAGREAGGEGRYTPNLSPYLKQPKPLYFNPRPQTPNRKPFTLHPTPYTVNPKP